MRRAIQTGLLFCLPIFTVGGCAAVAAYLPSIVAAITDATLILDNIKSFADRYFVVKPDPTLQEKVDSAVSRARIALDLAIRATQGASDLTQEQIDKAFSEFKDAYVDLLKLVEPIGVTTGDGIKVVPGGLNVPSPMALALKAGK